MVFVMDKLRGAEVKQQNPTMVKIKPFEVPLLLSKGALLSPKRTLEYANWEPTSIHSIPDHKYFEVLFDP